MGWTLRELSIAEPARVATYAEAHMERLSREAIRSLTKKMSDGESARLLALHAAARGRGRLDELFAPCHRRNASKFQEA